MEFVQIFVRALVAITLFVMSVHFGQVQAGSASDRAFAFTAVHAATSPGNVAPVHSHFVGEFDLADDCSPFCPTGCTHTTSLECCGWGVLGPISVALAVTAASDPPYAADRSMSGLEPDALEEPPQPSV